jgi:DinB family protein
MHASIGTVAEQFRITTNLYIKAMTGIDKAEAMRRPGPVSNPLLWMAGHVIQFRSRLLSLVGTPRDFPWGSIFDTGSKIGAPATYPEPEQLVAVWEEMSEVLMDRLAALTEADLAAPPAARVPSTDASLRGAIGYFSLHEAYHVGQMGYVRKWLGLSPIIDPPQVGNRG